VSYGRGRRPVADVGFHPVSDGMCAFLKGTRPLLGRPAPGGQCDAVHPTRGRGRRDRPQGARCPASALPSASSFARSLVRSTAVRAASSTWSGRPRTTTKAGSASVVSSMRRCCARVLEKHSRTDGADAPTGSAGPAGGWGGFGGGPAPARPARRGHAALGRGSGGWGRCGGGSRGLGFGGEVRGRGVRRGAGRSAVRAGGHVTAADWKARARRGAGRCAAAGGWAGHAGALARARVRGVRVWSARSGRGPSGGAGLLRSGRGPVPWAVRGCRAAAGQGVVSGRAGSSVRWAVAASLARRSW